MLDTSVNDAADDGVDVPDAGADDGISGGLGKYGMLLDVVRNFRGRTTC